MVEMSFDLDSRPKSTP